ncbi:class I SAM-dependent methyltransferase [Sulfurimonas sp. NWX79]|uniref:class I SAM-dependent methyltransferase n=1 Tax=Sulfurimonas sp. NWX79 TaxID=2925412 RepID=UPI003204FA56
MTTTEFYNINASQLINRYENVNMSSLHQLFLHYIPKNSRVLDIGFGSGRDLAFLKNNNYEIWGIDSSTKFIENAKVRFADISDHFIQISVPFSANTLPFLIKFDAIISIAMWMHLKKAAYENVIKNIAEITTDKATVIISYSQGKRTKDERYFEDVDLEYIIKLFQQYNFSLITTISNNDSLDRETLTWITVVFKHD